MEFPVRINKYLADKGMSSRREADRLIEAGKVLVNGQLAKLGQKIEAGDKVNVKREAKKKLIQDRVYLLFNKPRGIVTVNPQGDEKAIKDLVQLEKGVVPVGRLDKESSGLMILSNDGRITTKVLDKRYKQEKEYHVVLNKHIRPGLLRHLKEGVTLENDYTTKPAKVKQLSDKKLSLIIFEGKRHQIRRMMTAFGYEVAALKRVRIGGLQLADLKEGELLILKNEAKKKLLNSLGLN